MLKLFGGVFGVFLIAVIFTGIIGAFCIPYAINTWLVYAGKEAAVVWWQGFLLGIIPGVGQIGVMGAVATWVVMLFL